jgi:hypothetical protein
VKFAVPIPISAAAIALPVGITLPSLIVMPPLISAMADCIAEFMEEAFDSRAPDLVGEGVGAGESSHAIVTGGAEADIMGTIDVIDAEAEDLVVCAKVVEERAARAMVMVVERMVKV